MTHHPAIQLAQTLVRIPSLTATLTDYAFGEDIILHATAPLDVLAKHAQASGAKTEQLYFEGGHEKYPYGVYNLLADWTFGTPQKTLCFLGHTDVVPPGDVQVWSRHPFSGDIAGGYLHGRGATDMKGAVAAFFTAMAQAAAKVKNVRILAIITTDEEWAAVNGTRKVLETLALRGEKVDAFLCGEPSAQNRVGGNVKVGRRGSLNGKLVSHGVQGHAAYPQDFRNPHRALALAMAILHGHDWNDGIDEMPDTQLQITALTGGDFNATAVIPSQALANWNIRFTPAQTPEKLVQTLQELLASPPYWAKNHPDAAQLAYIGIEPNLSGVSMPYHSPYQQLELLNAVDAASVKLFSTHVERDAYGGTTDARFVQTYYPDAEVVEAGPPERGGLLPNGNPPRDYEEKGGMHQVDERISLKDLKALHRWYVQILKNYAKT